MQTNEAGHLEITVKSMLEGMPCHHCEQQTIQGYGRAYKEQGLLS